MTLMNKTNAVTNSLMERLPPVRGRLTPDAAIGHMTWFGVGGVAEVLFKPADEKDLQDFLKQCPTDIPVTVLGVASNLIIRDGGIPGVVIRLGRDFANIDVTENTVTAGSAALDMNVSLTALKHSLSGLEFLSGIPGTIGGALRMNAGAYGSETKDRLISADYLTRDGRLVTATPEDMKMSYRHNAVDKDVIFLRARFKGEPGDTAMIEQKMNDIKQSRAESQPIKSKTGGSTFANPDGHKAWQLIEAAGCRGLTIGGAQMSEKHCNFMINTGDATAADLERLGETVRQKVFENSGIMLRWEIRRIGIPAGQEDTVQA